MIGLNKKEINKLGKMLNVQHQGKRLVKAQQEKKKITIEELRRGTK